MAPEIGLISFRTFEKQVHGQDATSPQGFAATQLWHLYGDRGRHGGSSEVSLSKETTNLPDRASSPDVDA